MRQFTDGAEATLLVTEGGHIPHTSGGSGAEGKKLRKFVPRCCRYAESYYPPHPFFFERYIMETKYKLLVKGVGNYGADSLTELFWIIFRHRCEHFFKGEGFRD